jgi:hypothetical protein
MRTYVDVCHGLVEEARFTVASYVLGGFACCLLLTYAEIC